MIDLFLFLQFVLIFSPPLKEIVHFEYHNYDALVSVVNQLEQRCHGIGKLFSIGKSVQGRDLWVMKINSNITFDEFKPQFFYVGNIHGNEPVSKELLLHFAEDLCSEYERDKDIKLIIDKVEISILFSMNPDGYEVSPQKCTGVEGRYNANGADLNRNFKYSDYIPGEPLQPETKAVSDWINQNYFSLSAVLHGGDLVVSYPYDGDHSMVTKYLPSTDQEFIHQISENFASNSGPTFLGGCQKPFEHGITNGAQWYPMTNSLQDFVMYETSGIQLTIEAGCCKFPPKSELPGIYKMFKKPLVLLIKEVLRGVKGHIRSKRSKIKAGKISFKDHGKPIGLSRSGHFIKNLIPGIYEMTAEIEMEDNRSFKIVRNVEVVDGYEFTRVNIEIN